MNTLNVAQFSPFNRRLRKCSGSGSSYGASIPKTKGMTVCAKILLLLFSSSLDPLFGSKTRATRASGILITFTVHSSLSPSWYYLIRKTRKREFARFRLFCDVFPRFRFVGAFTWPGFSNAREETRFSRVCVEVSPRGSGWKREEQSFV